MKINLKREISIIIPHKNDVVRLSRLLTDIDQLNVNQCIIIDDGSNAENDPLFLSNDFPDFLFLKNKYGKGSGGARNTGLDVATGEWLLFVDSDDTLFVKEFKLIDLNDFRDFDIVFFAPTSHYDGTSVPSHRHNIYSDLVNDYIINNNKHSESLLRYEFIIPVSKLIKRKLVLEHKIRFEESIYANDRVFSIKTGHYAKEISTANPIIYSISFREGSLTRSHSPHSINIRFNEYMKGIQFLQKQMPYEQFKQLDFSYEAKGFLIKALIYARSPKTSYNYLMALRAHNIRIIGFNDLNPFSNSNHVIIGIKKMMINRRNRVK